MSTDGSKKDDPNESGKLDPQRYFVLSKDNLRNLPIDQNLEEGWKNYPPLFQGKNANHKLRMMTRKGIPESLRCAIWITGVVRISNPQQPEKATEEYGILSKVKILDHAWKLILEQLFPDVSDEMDAIVPDFGLGRPYLHFLVKDGIDDKTMKPIPPKGMKSLTRILCAVQYHLDVRYCPLLPHLTTILLSYMSESYAYATIREMMNESSRYFPLDEAQHYAWCKTFSDILHKMYPKTAGIMNQNTALSSDGLDPIFKRFFSPILRREHVIRVMDLYVTEGYKILYRIGITLIAVYKKQLKSMNINNAALWWAELRTITHSATFDFDNDIIKKAYGFHGSRLRKRVLFPRRRTIARMVKVNELWVEEHLDLDIHVTAPKPIRFMEYNPSNSNSSSSRGGYNKGGLATFMHGTENDENSENHGLEIIRLELARPAIVRASLAQWIPNSLQSCKLDLIYSTNVHGRSLNILYDKVCKSKRTVTLVEVLSNDDNNENRLVGMYASQAWHRSNHIYGDGECFLFSLRPEAKCYKWRPSSAGSVDDEKNEALMEQFMLSKDSFMAMGGNSNGSSGLKLNEDLTRGESSEAMGFDNVPLAGRDMIDFDIGLVEIYRFVRDMDGKGVDGEDDDIWML